MNPTTRMNLFLSILVLGMTLSCQPPNDPDPPIDPGVIMLELANQPRLTSMQVKLSANMADLPLDSLVLLRNNLPTDTLRLTRTDTVLSLTGLTPSTNYIWRVTGKKNTRPFASNPLPTRTMDTTSHDFTWRLDTLGNFSSHLRDVAIVNDTCVWVVGELLPPDYPNSWIYNAAMWNGKTWKQHRIETPSYPSGYMSAKPAWSILFIDGLLWITTNDGAYATSEDLGKTWKAGRYPIGSGRGFFYKAWADSRENIYWVGSNGSITHYDGKTFMLVESGTDYDLIDIYPDGDGKLWIGGYKRLAFDGIILLLESNTVKELTVDFGKNFSQAPRFYQFDIGVMLSSVDTRLFHIDSKTFKVIQTESVNGEPIYLEGLCSRIRGTGMNNIFLGGARGNFWHFNGSTWNHFAEQDRQSLNILSVDGSKNLFIAVGNDISMNSAAIVTARR